MFYRKLLFPKILYEKRVKKAESRYFIQEVTHDLDKMDYNVLSEEEGVEEKILRCV